SPSPCRLFATTSGDFDVSASSFQKTTPSQGIALCLRRFLHGRNSIWKLLCQMCPDIRDVHINQAKIPTANLHLLGTRAVFLSPAHTSRAPAHPSPSS